MLDLVSYFMGRDKLYPEELTLDIKSNAKDLVLRVNNLLHALAFPYPGLSSGWRPLAVNIKAGGAKRSLHMLGKAVDLKDPTGKLKEAVLKQPQLLLEYGLWMEDGLSTPTWCHLDTGVRSHRPLRVFKP